MLNRSLSEGIGDLKNLQELNLYKCKQLLALPEGISPRIIPLTSALAILARIDRDISSSVLLNRPLSEGFGQLRSLVTLQMIGCDSLRELPAGIPDKILPLAPLPFGHELCLNCLGQQFLRCAEPLTLRRVRAAAQPCGAQPPGLRAAAGPPRRHPTSYRPSHFRPGHFSTN